MAVLKEGDRTTTVAALPRERPTGGKVIRVITRQVDMLGKNRNVQIVGRLPRAHLGCGRVTRWLPLFERDSSLGGGLVCYFTLVLLLLMLQ